MTFLEWLGLLCVLAIVIPITTYLTVKLAVVAYLQGKRAFYRDNPDKENERGGP